MLDLKNDSNFKNSKNIHHQTILRTFNKFKKLRRVFHITQKDMSIFLGVDVKTYINYESGKIEPSFSIGMTVFDMYMKLSRIISSIKYSKEFSDLKIKNHLER